MGTLLDSSRGTYFSLCGLLNFFRRNMLMKKQITAVMAAFLSAAMAFNSLAATKLATPTGVQWSSEEEALP